MHVWTQLLMGINALISVPVIAIAVTVLHRRLGDLGSLVAAIGGWLAFLGALCTAYFLASIRGGGQAISVDQFEAANIGFLAGSAVTAMGLALLAGGLLVFSLNIRKAQN